MLIRLLLCALIFLGVESYPDTLHAKVRDTIFVRLSLKPKVRTTTTSQWLVQFLRYRGFRIAHRLQNTSGSLAIQMQWPNPHKIQLGYQDMRQEFKIPPAMKDPWLRARTVSNYIDFFLEQVLVRSQGTMRTRWKKAKQKLRSTLPSRSSRPPKARQSNDNILAKVTDPEEPEPRTARSEEKPPIVRTIVRKPPKPRIPVKRKQPPKVRRQLPPKPVPRPPPKPKVRKPAAVKKPAVVRRPAPQPKVVAKPVRRKPTNRKVALANEIRRGSKPLPVPGRLRIRFFVDLGASVGGPTTPGVLLGGELGLGVSIAEWRINLQGSVEGFLGNDDIQLLLVQPALTLGLPYLKFAQTFRLSLDLGAGIDVIRALSNDQELWRFRAGGLARLLLLWQANDNVSAYVRLSFFLSPQFYQFETEQELLADVAAWKLSLQIGVRFYGI